MSQIIVNLLAFAITFPIVITFIFYFIAKSIIKNKKKAVHKTFEYTGVIYLISTVMIMRESFGVDILGALILVLLIIFALFIIIQWKLFEDIRISRIWKIYLRFLFLSFFSINIIVVITAITTNLIN